MKNKYDVIIIGAGPAGLKCAEQFKDSNFSVLLIEKNKVIGPKTCAGGLTYLNKGFDFPKSKTRSFKRQTFYLGEKKYEIDLTNPVRTIDRYDLGQCLLDKIKDVQNITILRETVMKEVKKDRVITDKGDFYYQYLVGADGSSSIVRKYLGLPSEICIGLCHKVPKITDELVSHFNLRLLGAGYIWIFPHQKYTHIGVYFNPKYLSPPKAREILEDFLRENNFDYSKEKIEGAPIGFLYKECVFGNIFLIGDAAGLALELTGEGIANALISGQEIGRKILNPVYKMPNMEKALRIKARQQRMKNIFNMFSRSLFFQESLFRVFIYSMRTSWFQKYFGI